GTPGGLQSPTNEFPCAGGTALTRPISSPFRGAPRGRPYDGLLALNLFRPSGVIAGTLGLMPRSPSRCQTPVRSLGSNFVWANPIELMLSNAERAKISFIEA